jgi:hypothetical protein
VWHSSPNRDRRGDIAIQAPSSEVFDPESVVLAAAELLDEQLRSSDSKPIQP